MSNRWGEEEKKSKGIFGCAVAFLILGLSLYTFIINYKNLEGRRRLEAKMQNIIRTGSLKSEEEMIAEILDAAEGLELPITQENIDLIKGHDDYFNPVIDVRIDFEFEVDVLVTKFKTSLPIAEKVTIVVF